MSLTTISPKSISTSHFHFVYFPFEAALKILGQPLPGMKWKEKLTLPERKCRQSDFEKYFPRRLLTGGLNTQSG